ncbi:uncharacterized protein LOC122927078 [Bufo gargarizans]|uniref:uncharacterized protein LOC122927078 n=1 Tax=Bufo gargarizans TaxID=30331 RepID=UPI001CF50622|nr:uncharacterized protein LOC122927078 [Bufo gargarizans]
MAWPSDPMDPVNNKILGRARGQELLDKGLQDIKVSGVSVDNLPVSWRQYWETDMEYSLLVKLNICSLLCFLGAAYDGIISRPADRRNLFTERGCCKRHSNFLYIGQDISGSPVSVDVGLCRSHCGVPQRFNSYNSGIHGLSKHSSMLEFLKNKKLRERMPDTTLTSTSEPSCPHENSCQPTKVGLERVLLFQGVQEVEVIEDCQCNPTPQECIRMPFLKTFFTDTPFESTLDVGKCSSPTVSSGLHCSPTKFDTVVVDSPNGAEVVKTVETCEMKENCYRVTYLEYYYEVIYNAKGVKEERLKEIDVGRCLGGCSSGNHCLLRDSRNRDYCLAWAEGSGNGCVPQEYETYTFRSRNGLIRSVLAIKTCKCQM